MKTKKTIIALSCAILLILFTGYVLLDTFVIARPYSAAVKQSDSIAETVNSTGAATAAAQQNEAETQDGSAVTAASEEDAQVTTDKEASVAETETTSDNQDTSPSDPVITATSYSDGQTTITLNTYTVFDTTIYVADVTLSSAEYLKTAFASDIYGKNVTAKTSEIAEDNASILAINGDNYGSRNSGYVLRNGVAYRDTPARDQEDLVIYEDGTFSIITEEEVSLTELVDAGAYQIFSFGPSLVTDSEISVSQGEEVGKAMASNPRTAIGIVDDLHYLFVVSDGRTEESEGLSLYELAQVMQALGATTAYNLDGGGSSTMYFNGQLINNPTTNGNSIKERSVTDIVYIG